MDLALLPCDLWAMAHVGLHPRDILTRNMVNSGFEVFFFF